MSTQLPAHLLALFNAHPDAAAIGSTISSDAFAKIRYNGSKWKAIPASGEEIAIPTPYLDVIVVGINEYKSHTVYAKAYDPKGEPEAPIWSSDDGRPVPAEHEDKVVSDYRRWAVLLADKVDGGVYELRVSAGSMTNADRYITALRNFGAPVASMVTRITFDPAFDYPKLVFTPTQYLDEAHAAAVGKALASPSTINVAIGKAKATSPALSAPTEVKKIAAPAVEVEGDDSPAAPKATRKRKTAEAPAQVFTMPPATSQPFAAAATVVNPQPTSSNLDSLLSSIMSK
jgi:hypothetical protein